MNSTKRNARDPGKGMTVKIIVGAVVCVLLLILIVWLVQIVIRSGSSLLRDAGERPSETTAAEEEIWVPDVGSKATDSIEEVVPPKYDPEISESEDFSGDEGPENENLFEPSEFDEE